MRKVAPRTNVVQQLLCLDLTLRLTAATLLLTVPKTFTAKSYHLYMDSDTTS